MTPRKADLRFVHRAVAAVAKAGAAQATPYFGIRKKMKCIYRCEALAK